MVKLFVRKSEVQKMKMKKMSMPRTLPKLERKAWSIVLAAKGWIVWNTRKKSNADAKCSLNILHSCWSNTRKFASHELNWTSWIDLNELADYARIPIATHLKIMKYSERRNDLPPTLRSLPTSLGWQAKIRRTSPLRRKSALGWEIPQGSGSSNIANIRKQQNSLRSKRKEKIKWARGAAGGKINAEARPTRARIGRMATRAFTQRKQ